MHNIKVENIVDTNDPNFPGFMPFNDISGFAEDKSLPGEMQKIFNNNIPET